MRHFWKYLRISEHINIFIKLRLAKVSSILAEMMLLFALMEGIIIAVQPKSQREN